MSVLGALAAPRREVRVGTVTAVAAGVATVDVGGEEIDAQLTAQTAAVTVAATVYVLPVGDTWLVIASL